MTMLFLLFILFINETHGVIYYLNESEYERMPPIYKLDAYNSCLQGPSDAYCTVSFRLVSDEPNELLHMIKEYSVHKISHFDHTELRYGVCVTQNCQYHKRDEVVSEATLEACLNQSLWDGYNLKTRVNHFDCYSLSDNDIEIEIGDVLVGMVILSIIVLNVVGSVYDVFYAPTSYGDKSIVLIFSIIRNWKNLISITKNLDPRLKSLKSLNGLRSIVIIGVVVVHTGWPFIAAIENSHDMEMTSRTFFHYILVNGSIFVQLFFVISGFLLVYKKQLISETRQINWRLVPKGIFLRYIRLTPAYAVVIALTATWLKFLGPGPLWGTWAAISSCDCRKRWWLSLLYLNNLVYNSQCFLHTWYLAADMQLFCFGLIICVLLKKTDSRNIILMTLIALGIIVTAIHTYVRDLDGIILISPGAASTLFKTYPTFNEAYKMIHGNVASFVIGQALGYQVYGFQKKERDMKKYQKLKYIYWMVLPLIFGVVLSSAVFYRDAPRDPIYIRVLYAALARPVIGFLIAILLAGMILKLENIYRKFFEWKFWSIPSKLSYSLYIVHYVIIHSYVSMQTSLFRLTMVNSLTFAISIIIASSFAAILLYLLVEAPFTKLTKHISSGPANEENFKVNNYHDRIRTNDTSF